MAGNLQIYDRGNVARDNAMTGTEHARATQCYRDKRGHSGVM